MRWVLLWRITCDFDTHSVLASGAIFASEGAGYKAKYWGSPTRENWPEIWKPSAQPKQGSSHSNKMHLPRLPQRRRRLSSNMERWYKTWGRAIIDAKKWTINGKKGRGNIPVSAPPGHAHQHHPLRNRLWSCRWHLRWFPSIRFQLVCSTSLLVVVVVDEFVTINLRQQLFTFDLVRGDVTRKCSKTICDTSVYRLDVSNGSRMSIVVVSRGWSQGSGLYWGLRPRITPFQPQIDRLKLVDCLSVLLLIACDFEGDIPFVLRS